MPNQKIIIAITILSSLIFVWLTSQNGFRGGNLLNYSTVLAFSGSILALKTMFYNFQEADKHISSKNWFGFGLDMIFNILQIFLLIQGIWQLNQNSYPLNTMIYFGLSTIIFFAQIYIMKYIDLFKTALSEIFIFGFCAGCLWYLQINTPENQVFLLSQVFLSYLVMFVSLLSYFFTLKTLIKK